MSYKLERNLRLSTGLVLAVFVILHLANHTLGIFSVDAMEAVRPRIALLWQNPVGTILLYGSLLTHLALALRALYRRRTLRMPKWEAAQLILGLLIPVLLAGHIIGTRFNQVMTGTDIGYPYTMTVLWHNDLFRWRQPIMLVVVWLHVAVGLHYWLRIKPWYRQWLPVLYAFAVLLPALALLGYVRAGLIVEAAALDDSWRDRVFSGWNAASEGTRAIVLSMKGYVYGVLAASLLLTLAARFIQQRRRNKKGERFQVYHANGRVITGTRGQTMLESIRAAGVPHTSVCGGRARCTTCRVRVGEGIDALRAPSKLEAAALARVGAPPNVRLACQTRPQSDVHITPVIAASTTAVRSKPGGVAGREQRVACMFIDLRASTKLGEQRLPYDVVFILNQFFSEMSDALAETHGHYAQFSGDGLMALYGLERGFKQGCLDALLSARTMTRRLQALNERLSGELDTPLQIGIGVHSGEAIVGTMGPPSSPNFSAIGDNINIAARLEAQTKVFGCTLVVSAETAVQADLDLSEFPRHEADVRGRAGLVTVFAVEDLESLPLSENFTPQL